MRFHLTSSFAAATSAHDAAYAIYDALAERGIDTGPEAEIAANAEYEALAAVMLHPAVTGEEVIRKLALIDKRDMGSWTDLYPVYRARIDTDLREMMRPAPSPTMTDAFLAFAKLHRTIEAECRATATDEEQVPICAAYREAWRAAMDTPCTSPGDFVIKTYLQLLDDGGDRRANTFELLDAFPVEEKTDYNEDHGTRALIRSLEDCDLGRCLFAFGLPYFDADEWIAAAEAAHHDFSIIVNPDGKRQLYQGMCQSIEEQVDSPFHNLRRDRLMALIAFDARRVAEVITATLLTHPHRVMTVPEAAQA